MRSMFWDFERAFCDCHQEVERNGHGKPYEALGFSQAHMQIFLEKCNNYRFS